jgi:hypothetical protein
VSSGCNVRSVWRDYGHLREVYVGGARAAWVYGSWRFCSSRVKKSGKRFVGAGRSGGRGEV